MLALVNARSEAQVLTSNGGPSRWQTSVNTRALASTAAGRLCGLSTITAVGYMRETPLAGASCSRPGVLGVFAAPAGSWRLLEAPPPSSLEHDRIEVLGLEPYGNGISALLGSSKGTAIRLVAAWYHDGRWSASQPLRVYASERVSSFGPTGADGIFVLLTSSSGRARLAVASSAAAGWRQLPTPPEDTATVAFGPAASVDALAVKDTMLNVWTLASHFSDWVHAQSIRVPIEFGSSE